MGAKDDWNSWVSDLVRTLMELLFDPCGEFHEVQRAQIAKSTLLTSNQIPSPHLQLGPLGSFQIFHGLFRC